MAYSQDYRQMMIDKLHSGYSYRKLFAEYGVHTSTIQAWKKDIKRNPKRTNKINDEALRKDIENILMPSKENSQYALTVRKEQLVWH
ncbi:IS630 transposase-related protein [Ursidibacter arcticus]